MRAFRSLQLHRGGAGWGGPDLRPHLGPFKPVYTGEGSKVTRRRTGARRTGNLRGSTRTELTLLLEARAEAPLPKTNVLYRLWLLWTRELRPPGGGAKEAARPKYSIRTMRR